MEDRNISTAVAGRSAAVAGLHRPLIVLAVCAVGVVGYLARDFLIPTAGAVVLALVLMFSRVYLGVHYLGDVLGGLVYGLVWAAAWILLVPRPV